MIDRAWRVTSEVLGVLGRASVLSELLILVVPFISDPTPVAIWTVRTWAVWSRSPWILAILVPLLCATSIIDLINATPADIPQSVSHRLYPWPLY
jgi:hypothetical protein